MPMHLLLAGSGFFAVGRIVPRLQSINAGVQVLQCDGGQPAVASSALALMRFSSASLRMVPMASPRHWAAVSTLKSLRLGTRIDPTGLPIVMTFVVSLQRPVPLQMNPLRALKQASAKGLTRWEISDFPRGDTARPESLGVLLSGICSWYVSLLLANRGGEYEAQE